MPAGRPTKYKPEYCAQIEAFFDIEPYREVTDVYTYKDGTTKETIKLLPNDMPFIGDFAKKIKVNKDTLYEWAKKYPEFSDALKRVKELQEKLLVVNGLNGVYNSTFAIFAAKNMIGWRDRQELTGGDGGPIKVTVTNYGNTVTLPLSTPPISAPTVISD